MASEVFKEYLETIKEEAHRTRMIEVLSKVENEFQGLEPRVAWNQPMYTAHGTFIIGFSISKKHMAVSPEIKGMQTFSEAITQAGYSQTANLFRIKWEEPVDFTLLRHIIQYNIDDKADCVTFWRK